MENSVTCGYAKLATGKSTVHYRMSKAMENIGKTRCKGYKIMLQGTAQKKTNRKNSKKDNT
eukprot:14452758-Ditylum_brightwellii.AAC.2